MGKEVEFSFPSCDGKTTIHAVKWIPDNGEYHAILQITHGMIEFIERYREFANFLNEKGFMVVGHDHLGHGESVSSKSEYGFMREEKPADALVEDMHNLRTIVQNENKGVPYFMLGHSMGSYMLRKYLTVYNENLAGAIIMGTGAMPNMTMKFGMMLCKLIAKLKGWHYVSKFVTSLSFAGPYKKFDVTGKDASNSWLTKDEEIVKWYYSEPKCTFPFTVNGYYGLMNAVYHDCQLENIKKMPKTLPIFIVSGKDDPVGDMGKGVQKVFEWFKQAGMEDVTCKLYENDRHEILNETDRQQVYEDIADWLLNH